MGRMKTYKGWERSEKDLSDYLTPGDRIDEDIYNHLASSVPPMFCFWGFVQNGDCDFEEGGIRFYMTASFENGVYRYLGILPEFNNE